MRRFLWLLMILAILISGARSAAADPKADCIAGPVAPLTSETSVRAVLIERITSDATAKLRVSACVDTTLPNIISARIGLFSTAGRLLAIFGQTLRANVPVIHGTVRSQFFSVDGFGFGIDLNEMADQVIVEPVFAPPSGAQTFALFTPARFQGLTGYPMGALAPDSCLGALPRHNPAVRDIAVLTWPDGRYYEVSACVLSPVGRNIGAAAITFHPLNAGMVGGYTRLHDVLQAGNSVVGMHPLIGFPQGGGRTIGLLQASPDKTPEEAMAAPYQAIIVAPNVTVCPPKSGPDCQFPRLFNLPFGASFTFLGRLPQ